MKPFEPAWWLNNAHLQTIYPAFWRPKTELPERRRERLITPDNDFLDLDWYGQGNGAIVVLLHGLTGSSNSGYIKGLQKKLSDQGFRSAALNFRGCSGELNRKARCYHSGETEDIQFLYRTLKQREPDTPIAVVGFSLGGNVLLKWLGEQQDRVKLFAAVAVSVPFVLSTCATKMDTGFSKLYRNSLIGELKHYITEKISKLEQIGDLNEAQKVKDIGDLAKVKSFWEYDHRVVAFLHGYLNVHDYYQRASSRPFIKTITNPTLLIQAKDDPFMVPEVIPGQHELSASVRLEVSNSGGHVGFVGGTVPFRPEFWLEHRIPTFLKEQLPV